VASDSSNGVADSDSGDGPLVSAGGIVASLRAFAAQFDPKLQSFLSTGTDVPEHLLEAMRYSALAPGKRLRPYLVVRCCELVGGQRDHAWHPAAALECVHAFSLIHDDLPAMDDDDLRRGRPTCHKVYGEATAILAGDALLALAFELLAIQPAPRDRALAMVSELAAGAGWSGMIGGQAADIGGEQKPPSADLTRYIHERKTAALFRTACRLGALAGSSTDEALTALEQFGQSLGVAFQIADDLLDVREGGADIGKRTGKDAASGKQTFPRCVGEKASRALAVDAVAEAKRCLDDFGPQADDLRCLADYVINRNY